MMPIRCIVAALALCLSPAVLQAAETRVLDVRPVYQGPVERTFFYAASGNARDMLELYGKTNKLKEGVLRLTQKEGDSE